MTHQRNLILQAAVAAAFGFVGMSAHAGTGSALPAKIATQAIISNATAVKGNPVTYSTQVPLSANTVYYVYVKLTNGTFGGTPLVANGVFTSNNTSLSKMLNTSSKQQLSNDATFAVYTLGSTAHVIPVNATISFTPKGTNTNLGEIDNLTGLLGGGNVNAVISIGATADVTTTHAEIDSAAGGNIITFQPAQIQKGAASSANNFSSTFYGVGIETAQINVSGGTGIALTNNVNVPAAGTTSTINFGALQFIDVAGTQNANQSTFWTIANEYITAGTLGAVITGNFAAATSVYTSVLTNCSTSLDTGVLNAGKTTATITNGTPQATGVSQFVCMTVNGSTVIQATQPTISATLSTTAGSKDPGSPITFATVSLYNLMPNGGTVYIRNYVPAAFTGYVDAVRIINVGQVSASVQVARIDPVTGLPGTPATLPGGAIAAGGATNYPNTVIEAALGGASATQFFANDRPRLVFTANTTIEGQNYVLTYSVRSMLGRSVEISNAIVTCAK